MIISDSLASAKQLSAHPLVRRVTCRRLPAWADREGGIMCLARVAANRVKQVRQDQPTRSADLLSPVLVAEAPRVVLQRKLSANAVTCLTVN